MDTLSDEKAGVQPVVARMLEYGLSRGGSGLVSWESFGNTVETDVPKFACRR
jgi:hypothetical protein